MKSTSRRVKIPARRIVSFAVTILIVAFLCTLTITTNTFAANAVWNENGVSVTYEGDTYNQINVETIKQLGLPSSSKAYMQVEEMNMDGKVIANVIYYDSSNSDSTGSDSEKTISAKYLSYTKVSPTVYSDPSVAAAVTIDKQSDAPNDSEEMSACKVEGGLGWIICPVTNTLAKGVDWIYGVISGFLKVRPIATSHDNALYRVWSYMLGIANIAFVIAFLIIIYSQLTNRMLDSYGLKKMIPRLIVAAILVNISYYICAVGIDISNILGFSIQDTFMEVRNNLVGSEGNSWDLLNFEGIADFILSGGTVITAATAGTIGLITTLSTYGVLGSVFLLLPTLLAILMSVLIAVLVLAARQALITILVVISPLAFVAYLLPNTEKWFEKWRETLMTMLIMFPAFSLLFGGSQLAGSLIIQNADSINTVILGLAVQVIPLAITPFLIKLSGSIISKVAGIIDNPNKGILDRTRNYMNERADERAAERLASKPKKHEFLRQYGQRRDFIKRKRASYKKYHESVADNRFNDTQTAADIHQKMWEAETDKKRIEQRLDRDLKRKVYADRRLLEMDMRVRTLSEEASFENANLDRFYAGVKTGNISGDDYGRVLSDLSNRSYRAARDISIAGMASEANKRVLQGKLADQMLADSKLVEAASGIDKDTGVSSAIAKAIATKRSDLAKIIEESNQVIKHFNPSADMKKSVIYSKEDTKLVKYKEDGSVDIEYVVKKDDKMLRYALIENLMQVGSGPEIMDLIKASGKGQPLYDYRTTIAEAIPKYGVASKIVFASGKPIETIGQGNLSGEEGLLQIAREAIMDGKIRPDDLAANDPDVIKVLQKAATEDLPRKDGESDADYLARQKKFETFKGELKKKIREILDPSINVGQNASSGTLKQLEKFRDVLPDPKD